MWRNKSSRILYVDEVKGKKFNVNKMSYSSEVSEGNRKEKYGHQARRDKAELQDSWLNSSRERGRQRRGYLRGRKYRYRRIRQDFEPECEDKKGTDVREELNNSTYDDHPKKGLRSHPRESGDPTTRTLKRHRNP